MSTQGAQISIIKYQGYFTQQSSHSCAEFIKQILIANKVQRENRNKQGNVGFKKKFNKS